MRLWLEDVHEDEAPAGQAGGGDMKMAKENSNMGQGLYLVLGCGDVGFAIASRLKCRAKVVIIERDERKVEHIMSLMPLDYETILGDFSSTDVLKRADIERADAVIITVRDFPTIERALKAIGELKAQLRISPLVLVLVPHEAGVPEAERLGADEALPSNQIIADFVIGRLEKISQRIY
jgi:Trk K+ transport system NAD-binding subunit